MRNDGPMNLRPAFLTEVVITKINLGKRVVDLGHGLTAAPLNFQRAHIDNHRICFQ
jgi:hypothetical protein